MEENEQDQKTFDVLEQRAGQAQGKAGRLFRMLPGLATVEVSFGVALGFSAEISLMFERKATLDATK